MQISDHIRSHPDMISVIALRPISEDIQSDDSLPIRRSSFQGLRRQTRQTRDSRFVGQKTDKFTWLDTTGGGLNIFERERPAAAARSDGLRDSEGCAASGWMFHKESEFVAVASFTAVPLPSNAEHFRSGLTPMSSGVIP
jgi:hypothetical protein